MADVRLNSLRKSFGEIEIIKGVDLEIADGEFCVFVGPSGCGKSTLLRMIAGLEEITSGRLQIGGQEMNDVEPAERGVAMVFDKLPETYMGLPVINADDTDLRFLDPRGVIAGLKAKGRAKKDTSGFVRRVINIKVA